MGVERRRSGSGINPHGRDRARAARQTESASRPGSLQLSFEEIGTVPDEASHWHQAPFTQDKRGVVLTLTINGQAASMVLDSAATNSVLKRSSSVFDKGRQPCKKTQSLQGFCGLYKGPVSIAGLPLKGLELAVVSMGDVPFDGLLGIDFFTHHEVFLDFASKTAFIR